MPTCKSDIKPGAILKITKVDFLHKPKYCLVMECINNIHDNTIVLFLTSRVDKYQGRPWTVEVKQGCANLPKESIIDCNNYFRWPNSDLESSTTLTGFLPQQELKRVYSSVKYAKRLGLDDLIRIINYQPY